MGMQSTLATIPMRLKKYYPSIILCVKKNGECFWKWISKCLIGEASPRLPTKEDNFSSSQPSKKASSDDLSESIDKLEKRIFLVLTSLLLICAFTINYGLTKSDIFLVAATSNYKLPVLGIGTSSIAFFFLSIILISLMLWLLAYYQVEFHRRVETHDKNDLKIVYPPFFSAEQSKTQSLLLIVTLIIPSLACGISIHALAKLHASGFLWLGCSLVFFVARNASISLVHVWERHNPSWMVPRLKLLIGFTYLWVLWIFIISFLGPESYFWLKRELDTQKLVPFLVLDPLLETEIKFSKGEDTTVKLASISTRNLKFATLRGLDLSELNINDFDFSYSTLEDVSFRSSTLRGNRFEGARFKGVSFDNSKISECDFSQSTLRDTSFQQSTLRDTSFQQSTLQNNIFRLAILNDVDFRLADITDSAFRFAEMKEVHFDWANVARTEFEGVKLSKASYLASCLQEVTWRNSEIRDSIFTGTALDNSSLRKNKIYNHAFEGSYIVGTGTTALFTNQEFANHFFEAVLANEQYNQINSTGEFQYLWPRSESISESEIKGTYCTDKNHQAKFYSKFKSYRSVRVREEGFKGSDHPLPQGTPLSLSDFINTRSFLICDQSVPIETVRRFMFDDPFDRPIRPENLAENLNHQNPKELSREVLGRIQKKVSEVCEPRYRLLME